MFLLDPGLPVARDARATTPSFWFCIRLFCPLLLSSFLGPLSSVLHVRPLRFLPYYRTRQLFPSPPFSGYILPRDCSLPAACCDPFSISSSPVRVRIHYDFFIKSSPSPHYPTLPPALHPITIPPLLGFRCTTISVQYTSPPAVLLFLHQYTLPGARESAYSNLSFACGTVYVHMHHALPLASGFPILPPAFTPPPRSYHRTFPGWLIIHLVFHFPISLFLLPPGSPHCIVKRLPLFRGLRYLGFFVLFRLPSLIRQRDVPSSFPSFVLAGARYDDDL